MTDELTLPVPLQALRYTLCFLTHRGQVLMLKRSHPPNQGLWNGVGGRIEPGETPIASCRREVFEETGFCLDKMRFAGLLTWRGFEITDGGLYLFNAPVSSSCFKPTHEGLLAWKPSAWVCSAPQVVSNIHVFAPFILDKAPPQVFHFEYEQGRILSHTLYPIPASLSL